MRIEILTNTDERCGNAQYARNLRDYLLNDSEATKQMADIQLCVDVRAPHPDVLIVNWHPAKVTVTAEMVKTWQSWGIKVILILQNSFDWGHHIGNNDLLALCDAVVAHEPMDVKYNWQPAQNFHYIPHGILEVKLREKEDLHPPTFGMAGFPFTWKRPDVLVKAAKRCDVYARIFAPKYPGYSYGSDSWHRLYEGRVVMHENFLDEQNIVSILSKNILNIFWFKSQDVHDRYGQSGSVRLGIAAKRPMIISRHRKFRDLLPYEDCFYICDTEEEVYETSEEIYKKVFAGEPVKLPERVFEDQKWSKAAQKYWSVIRSI